MDLKATAKQLTKRESQKCDWTKHFVNPIVLFCVQNSPYFKTEIKITVV